MPNVHTGLTGLQRELFEYMDEIAQQNLTVKYKPRRVEPGRQFTMKEGSKWSKYSGESLYINEQLLSKPSLRKFLLRREALLLFIPKAFRNFWWVELLASIYPLSARHKIDEEKVWLSVCDEFLPNFDAFKLELKKLLSSAGSSGLIELVKLSVLQTIILSKDLNFHPKGSYYELSEKEFSLLLTKVYNDSIGLSSNAMEILQIALVKQTISSSTLAPFSNKHPTTISKQLKKLQEMSILYPSYMVNYQALGLAQYFVLFNCTKNQALPFNDNYPKTPYLHTQKVNCLSSCIVTQHYTAPDSAAFKQQLESYCSSLLEQNKISSYYLFTRGTSYRSYQFSNFDAKTKQYSINLGDISINCGLTSDAYLSSEISSSFENTLVPYSPRTFTPIDLKKDHLEILNQFLLGLSKRRDIQKKVRRSMNTTVALINELLENGYLFELVSAIMPDCKGEFTLYIDTTHSSSTTNPRSVSSLHKQLQNLSYNLPHVYFADLEGTFDGIMFHAYLPYKTTIELIDFLNWLIPVEVEKIMIIGKPIFQKRTLVLDPDRRVNSEWLLRDDDFAWKK